MNGDSQIQALEKMIGGIIDTTPGIFLVEMKLLPGNNIKVFVDGDNGIAIDKLVQYNRGFYKQIEESGFFQMVTFRWKSRRRGWMNHWKCTASM